MLPSLALPCQDGFLLAHDVPVGVFFADYPLDAEQGNRQRWEGWANAMLLRAVAAPTLTPALLDRLGPERDGIARSYLHAVGWLSISPELIRPATAALVDVPPLDPQHLLTCLPRLPSGTIRADILALSERANLPPHVVWAHWSIADFMFSVKALIPEQSTVLGHGEHLTLVQRAGLAPDHPRGG